MKIFVNRNYISIILILSIIFSSVLVASPVNAAITRKDVRNVVKWGTIAGVLTGAVIGAASLGFGGLLLGAGTGALISTFISSRLGVKPEDQWKLVFPHGLLPFKYTRQHQHIINGSSIPSASTITNVSSINRFASRIKQKYNATKIKYLNAYRNESARTNRTSSMIRVRYENAYRRYTNALQRGKSSFIVRKAREEYQKAKFEFQKLFNK